MVKLTTFTIPTDAAVRYPIDDGNANRNLKTNSWFDHNGIEMLNYKRAADVKPILRCEQIKVTPNIKQRAILLEWMILYRCVYNETVAYIRKINQEDQIEYNKLIEYNKINDLPKPKQIKSQKLKDTKSLISLRPIIRDTLGKNTWLRIDNCKLPSHTIDNAISDVIKAYKSSNALHKGMKSFRIRFKKENANQSLVLETSSFSKCKNSFSSHIGEIKTSSSIKGIKHDSRLTLRNGKFMLFAPRDKIVKESICELDVCSLDPGVCTFQTIYGSDGTIHKIGSNVRDKLRPLIRKLDKKDLNLSYVDDPFTHTRYTTINRPTARYFKRIRDKIKHVVDDLHWKTANIVCKIASKVLIGNLSTISILKKKDYNKEEKRLLQTLSHFTFRQRLEAKCQEYGIEFSCVDESYTSKTCGSCGKLNDVKLKRHYDCISCKFSLDRDINGARNIMIKTLQ